MEARVYKTIKIIGCSRSYEFNKIKILFKIISLNYPSTHIILETLGDVDWMEYLKKTEKRIGSRVAFQVWPVIMITDDTKVRDYGEIIEYMEQTYYSYPEMFLTKDQFKIIDTFHLLNIEPNKIYVYLVICVGKKKIGRMIIQLFNHIYPEECCQFLQSCTNVKIKNDGYKYIPDGSIYKGAVVNRIVKNGWIQFESRPRRKSKDFMNDLPPVMKFTKRGMVSFVNNAGHSSHSIDFCITLDPMKYMNGTHFAVGRVIEDCNILSIIEDMPTMNTVPIDEIKIIRAGVFDAAKKKDILDVTCFCRENYESIISTTDLINKKIGDKARNLVEKEYKKDNTLLRFSKKLMISITEDIVKTAKSAKMRADTIDANDVTSAELKIIKFTASLFCLPKRITKMLLQNLNSIPPILRKKLGLVANKVTVQLEKEHLDKNGSLCGRIITGLLATTMKNVFGGDKMQNPQWLNCLINEASPILWNISSSVAIMGELGMKNGFEVQEFVKSLLFKIILQEYCGGEFDSSVLNIVMNDDYDSFYDKIFKTEKY